MSYEQQKSNALMQRAVCVPSKDTPVNLVITAGNPEQLQKQLMAIGMEIDTIRLWLREQGK